MMLLVARRFPALVKNVQDTPYARGDPPRCPPSQTARAGARGLRRPGPAAGEEDLACYFSGTCVRIIILGYSAT